MMEYILIRIIYLYSFQYYNLKKNKSFLILTDGKLKKSCDIGLSTVMVDKKIFDDENLKFASLKTKEDFVLWLKIAKKKIKIVGLDQKLSKWRKIPNSLSSFTIQKILDGFRVYRVHLGYSRIKSFIFLLILSVNFILKS